MTKKQHRKKGASRVQVKCPECATVFLPSIVEIQSRAGASARRKGATFERGIAKKLEKWYQNKYRFVKTPQSGGSVLKDDFDMAGDICTTHKKWPWHLELKNTPSQFKGLHNFFSNKSIIWKWLKQAKKDCPNNRVPLLIFNRFDQPTYCAIESKKDSYIEFKLQDADISYYLLNNIYTTIIIWKLEDMLKTNPELWE